MRLCLASTALAAVVATSFLPSAWAQSTANITFSNLTTPYNPSAINLDTGANLTTTLKAVWTRNQSQGVFNDGLKLLAGEVSGATLYGALLRFDTSSYIDANSTSDIPFVALVSCDQPETTTAPTNSSTLSPNASMSIFDAAAKLGAQAVILYSSSSQSCILNLNMTDNSTLALPVYSLPSQASTNMLLQQYNNIADAYQTFNSTALAELTGSSSSLVSSNSSEPVPFLVAVITSNQTFENTSPIVATIGSVVPAASTTTAKGPASTTGTTPTTTTGANGTSSTPSSTPRSGLSSSFPFGDLLLRGTSPSLLGSLGLLHRGIPLASSINVHAHNRSQSCVMCLTNARLGHFSMAAVSPAVLGFLAAADSDQNLENRSPKRPSRISGRLSVLVGMVDSVARSMSPTPVA
ncbi:BZ3500_MvSof-1268-A1-R1_Chr1-1g00925 [Microbotryum saponariae]|uniref:BZ3500_MvSof-1268-A1-R1_Chr1-1g00925 protein n=1 Tax=Microbotryum saponariae TaxID=289078 RepID=A0A2X0K8T5_9BASI|nr:BZ3500_MvSof-1268-A1-R1_Chr1-1g00925 [Microbotryum saponariae]SCZ92949.1 BZ3501_MvSof-1269-A2-R1_Chr1-1g00522 [Microbotryum saponariae]